MRDGERALDFSIELERTLRRSRWPHHTSDLFVPQRERKPRKLSRYLGWSLEFGQIKGAHLDQILCLWMQVRSWPPDTACTPPQPSWRASPRRLQEKRGSLSRLKLVRDACLSLNFFLRLCVARGGLFCGQVLTIGDGVDGFTLDPRSGEFVLSHPKLTIPKFGKTYSRALAASLESVILV